jgi:hypothetical protein
VVGKHHVVADLDAVLACDHRVKVEKAALADPYTSLWAKRQPTPRFKQGVGPDLEAPIVKGLEDIALYWKAQKRPAPRHVAVYADAIPRQRIALVPPPFAEI